MNIGIPQFIILAICLIGIGRSLADDGKEKVKKESFIATLIAVCIELSILWWGGFFG